jgi:hypothetical protein
MTRMNQSLKSGRQLLTRIFLSVSRRASLGYDPVSLGNPLLAEP